MLVSLHNILSPPQIVVEPQKFEEKIPAGDSLIRAITIKNIGILDKIISINTESIENLVSIDGNDFNINSEQTKIINFSLNIPLKTPLGEYRGSIEIIYENNTLKKIPIFLIVLPQAQFQATIGAPDKVNKTDYFKVNINIKNIGESPVHGIKIRLNTSGLNLTEIEKEKTIGLLSKNSEFSTNWWFEANQTGWQTISFDINSNNAGNQTEIAVIKVE